MKDKRIEIRQRKRENVQRSTQLLIDQDIDFTVHNLGIHLIITCNKGIIDFWPSTGRWIHRNGKDYTPGGRGVLKLLSFIEE